MGITLTVILIALVSALIGLVLVVVRRLEPAGEEHRTKAAFEESPGELELSEPMTVCWPPSILILARLFRELRPRRLVQRSRPQCWSCPAPCPVCSTRWPHPGFS